MVLSNFRLLPAALPGLCVDHRYLWFAGCFVKQWAFQSEANIQQSDHASTDFDDRTIIMFFDVQPKLMVKNFKQLWQRFFTFRWLLYWPGHYCVVCLVEVRGGDIINYHQVIIIIIDQATRYWPQMITKMIMAIIRLTTTLTFVWSWAAEEVAAVII